MVVPVSTSRDEFYAVNNEFLVTGPKGSFEFTMVDNEDMFIRLDLPGVPNDGVRVTVDPTTRKEVTISALAPKNKRDSSPRIYGCVTGIVCSCCEISTFTLDMRDGVLRLLLSKRKSTSNLPSTIAFLGGPNFRYDLRSDGPHRYPHGTDPNDPALTGPALNPNLCVKQGSQMAYESKKLQNGSLYVRVDMPGVPAAGFTVSVTNGRVMVTGEAPAVSHDSGGRFYSGHVAKLDTLGSFPSRRIKTIAKDGVIRLTIPPL